MLRGACARGGARTPVRVVGPLVELGLRVLGELVVEPLDQHVGHDRLAEDDQNNGENGAREQQAEALGHLRMHRCGGSGWSRVAGPEGRGSMPCVAIVALG